MNSWTTYYHEALRHGLNHSEALTLANNLYEAETAVILQDECSCGRGDGCDCDGMEEKARADEEEGKREATDGTGFYFGSYRSNA